MGRSRLPSSPSGELSSLAEKGSSLPATMWVIWPGPQKAQEAKTHCIFPSDQAPWILSSLLENPDQAWTQTLIIIPSARFQHVQLSWELSGSQSSSGPRNNIPDNLLTKWSLPFRTQQSYILIAFSLFLQKGFYLLSVNLPCQKHLSSTLVLVFFLAHCRLITRILDKGFGYFEWKGLCSVKSHSWLPPMQII